MAIYKMEDGSLVDTSKAKARWDEQTEWNGNNNISKATGSQWEHEKLYLSAKGRYYVVHTSQWQGHLPYARWLTPLEAAQWLLHNDEELPEDLADLEGEAIE